MLKIFFGVGLVLSPIAAGAQEPAAVDPAVVKATLLVGESAREQEELRRIYEGSGGGLLWTTPARRFALLKMIVSLEADGIDLQRLGDLPAMKNADAVQEDVLATRAILRAGHLMAGTVADERHIPGWHIAPNAVDVAAALTLAAHEERLGAFLNDLRPNIAAYAQLRSAYFQYRTLDGPWPRLPDAPRIVESGDPRFSEIVRRLTALGDLMPTDTDDQAHSQAIKRFQDRHGLDADGRIGPATLAQLNVTPAARARQIAVNLEYWRRLPRTWPTRYVAVNIAAAHLEVMLSGKVAFSARTIVGDPAHPTPVLATQITGVTFNPPWTVPFSIATAEMLPKLRRDSSYLERNKIEIVDRPSDPYGLGIDWQRYSRANFPFQFRQVPGPGNALGRVKLEMPNHYGVYLHDTSDRSLFDRSSRALSHGCVRVQSAQELAEHLLDDPAVWMTTDLLTALQEIRTVRFPLKHPVPVFLLYFTAYPSPDGGVNFRPDLYGRDSAVQAPLSARRASIVANEVWAKGFP
jgi:murein L,D-transpeptidase YcbB/YkuD